MAVFWALLLTLWALTLPWQGWIFVSLVVGLGCAVVISSVRLPAIGAFLIGLFCFTASWDDVSLGSAAVRQLLLLSGGLLLAPTLDLRRLPPVPWWLHAYGLAAVVASCLQVLFPSPQSYYSERYATSATGQALGERPGLLSALASLLFNNYAIPVVLLLACMARPRALRWFVAAYVTGAAVCCLAAILGYYGYPTLLNLFGVTAYPSGFRAAGFTSHPLRLGLAAFAAMGLACWMALQRDTVMKWGGWVSVPLLLGGLYVSGSRGGEVAGLLVLILSMFLLPAVRQRIHVVVGALGIAILAFLFVFPSAVESILGTTRLVGDQTTTLSDAGRAEVMAQGIRDWHESPFFGIGVQYVAEAHTLYLGVLAAGGLVFGLGFLLFNVGSLVTAVQAMKVDRMLGGALVATLVAMLGYWTVADLIQTKTVAIIFGFVIAVSWFGRAGVASHPGAIDAFDVVSHHDETASSGGERALGP